MRPLMPNAQFAVFSFDQMRAGQTPLPLLWLGLGQGAMAEKYCLRAPGSGDENLLANQLLAVITLAMNVVSHGFPNR
jgi:hypothetical protein